MTDLPTWTPRHDGDAPPDWDGGRVQTFIGGEWEACLAPAWVAGATYCYTPKSAPVNDMPSDAALLVAHKRVLPNSQQPDAVLIKWGRESKFITELARMIERYEPHLLRDPLEDVLREASMKATLHHAGAYSAITTELRKRGVKLEGEGA